MSSAGRIAAIQILLVLLGLAFLLAAALAGAFERSVTHELAAAAKWLAAAGAAWSSAALMEWRHRANRRRAP